MNKILKIHKDDIVAVALEEIVGDSLVSYLDQEVRTLEDIPAGHKVALRDIRAGEEIIKYGHPIGIATHDIKAGDWVHIHNVRTALSDLLDYTYTPSIPVMEKKEPVMFSGYRRKDGKVGIRNAVWIIPTVGCVNHITRMLASKGKESLPKNVDDVIAFPHPYGCSQMSEDKENTRQVLADFALHPNAGAVLIVGLGCENINISVLEEALGDYDKERIFFLNCQDVEDEMEVGFSLLQKALSYANQWKREPIPASELIIGLKCGGSDGFSGITANPVVGQFSDLLIGQGGTTILTEVPEMFGAETILMNRCINKEVFDKTVTLINDFKTYFTSNHQPIYENPAPGNKVGGITTLEDKSLGCTQKAGSAPVSGVLNYAEPVKSKGLHLLCAPGNDLVAATALCASGAHIVLFTTGRGTPFSSPVPTVKIASNSVMAKRKANWIDFDAGKALDGVPLSELGEDLFSIVIDIASGKKAKSEEDGFADMAIFKTGVTV